MVNQAATITLSKKQRKILENMRKGTHSPLHFIERSSIILMAADGITNKEIARKKSCNRNTVKKWRNRIAQALPEINRTESELPHLLHSHIKEALSDEQRAGGPCKFTPEQVAHIIAIACEDPDKYDVPMSHWTPSALARKVIELNIVESISPRQVGRFLKRSEI